MLAPSLQVRNKTVYLQYSTRSEIGSGNWGFGGAGGSGGDHHQSGNVILIIMDNIQVRIHVVAAICSSSCPLVMMVIRSCCPWL
jgi:hypothetical protein